jgi:hypothetical protein
MHRPVVSPSSLSFNESIDHHSMKGLNNILDRMDFSLGLDMVIADKQLLIEHGIAIVPPPIS